MCLISITIDRLHILNLNLSLTFPPPGLLSHHAQQLSIQKILMMNLQNSS